MVEMKNAYNILVEKLEGKTPLGRPRRKWEHTIKMDVWETVGLCGVDASGSL
jgi:hypothetical protein